MARKMKDSGIEWIGEIPEGWEITRLKYLADFEPTCDTSYLTDESKITYTPMECVKNGGFENRSALYGSLSHTLTPFQNGDIAMAKVTPCFENGNIAIMDNLFSGFGLGSSELFIFRPKSIFTRYFFYWLQNKTFVARACSTMTGTGGLKRISPSFIRNCPVHCPSTDEQTKISDYLDAKCSEIDDLLTSVHSSIEEYKKLKQSVITQAVPKGVRGEREMKDSGVEWIGEIPKEWDILNLVAHTSMLTPMRDRPENLDGPIPWIRIEDFDGKYISSSKASLGVSKETVRSMNLKIYPVGTILCTSSCIMGKCAIVSRELVSNQRFIGIIPDQNTCENFLYYLMLSNSERMNYLATGALQANLSRSSFEHLKVQFPSYQEQKEISDYLDTKCAEIDKLIAKKEQLVKELESYKKSLIYEVVTGKREV